MKDVRNQLCDVRKHTEAVNETTIKILQTLKVDWLRNIGKEIRCFVRKIFFTNVAIYKAILDIRGSLPIQLERCLYQEPFILEDGMGRIAPVHMQFISSWKAFDSVLELRFQGMQGYGMVQEKKYVMQESAAKREIERSRPWEASFLPGQKVVMSMLFDDAQGNMTSCPRCQTPSQMSQDSDIQWYDDSPLSKPLWTNDIV